MYELRPLFVDIDGTLTTEPHQQWGPVIEGRLRELREMLHKGVNIVLWSGGGTEYARAFADKYGLGNAICIGKPDAYVDDNPTIRPVGTMRHYLPSDFFDA